MPHVQILTIQEEADRVIFGSPPRKPAFNEIRNLNRMQASGDEGSGVPASGSSKHGSPAVEAPSSRRINTTAEVQGYEHGVAVSSRDTTLNHVAGAIRDAIDDYNGKDEEDQRGRSAESTPTKASSHQRAPTPHSNMMFASRTTAGASAPMKAEMAPLTSNESTTAAATSATNPIKTFAVHPPRSDSLRDMRAAAARTQAVSTATSSANEMSKPTAAAAFRKLPHPVAESSFEAFLTKAKSTILDSIPSSERNPSQMLPEIQGPHPLKTFSAQGTPAEHSTAFSSFQDEESTSSGRMTRRDTNTTASGSQLTGQEVSWPKHT